MVLRPTALSRLAPVCTALACFMMAAPQHSGASRQTDRNRSVSSEGVTADEAETARTLTQREPIPYPTLRRASSVLRRGTTRTLRSGVNGQKMVVYRVYTRQDGSEVRREVDTSRILRRPVSEVIEEGSRATLPSRGYFSGRRVVVMRATTYNPYHCGGSGTGRTCSGLLGGYGVVAVDPRFIPLGTRLYVEGYGYAVAADTGGAIKGNRIDLGVSSRHDAAGIRNMRAVRVHILD